MSSTEAQDGKTVRPQRIDRPTPNVAMDRPSKTPDEPRPATSAPSVDRAQLQSIFEHALRGARAAGARSEVAREAAEMALGKFEFGVVSELRLEQPAGWAYRVGYRAALLLRRSRRGLQSLEDLSTGITSYRPPSDAKAPTLAERIEEFIALARDHCESLTPRQCEVLASLRSDRSLKANARHLDLEPCNLRRMLRSIACRALRAAKERRRSES